ncbi:MAG: DUF5615 family PIN-like protein [Candidatus Schekmanbacteria bacterium]|nr:DUF5615 family PIN-like protein [Candidatus Schekmanbacteria bacterium]
MKFKLDENFGNRTQELFRAKGYDVQSVLSQRLSGCSDSNLYEVCYAEQRCLITLDLDFADVLRFPPSRSYGIVVIRISRNNRYALLELLVRQFLNALSEMSVTGKLWIVEMGRIRIHEANNDNE